MSRLDEIRNKLRGQIRDETNKTIDSLRSTSVNTDQGSARGFLAPVNRSTRSLTRREEDNFGDAELSENEWVWQPNKRALFVGNNAYVHLNQLDKCVNDAREMQKLFADIRYRIVYDFDQNLDDMRKIFNRFKEDIQPGDEIVVNFSGHGLQINSETYLCPIDMPNDQDPRDSFKTCVNLNQEMDEMFQRGAKMVLAIVDACRNQFRIDYQDLYRQGVVAGATGEALEESIRSKSGGARFLESGSGPSGRAIVFATSHDTYSYERSDLNHGIFTHFFLQEARIPGRSIGEVIEIVRNMVCNETNNGQNPAFYNDLNGQFYFQQ
ncbi:MAG: caspase domain-containing protein [Burkholderiaceae bacterium]